jgi:ABC-type lipoprotein export system ATPase subunit
MSEENIIFKIRNLECTYPGHHKRIIYIDHLDIPSGKLIIILGKSGVGKSTLLETLGLMNNTMQSGSSIALNLEKENKEYFYEHLWKQKSQRNIEQIRNRHYSFIFQSTNLMSNFTADENVIMSMMIQGKKRAESIHDAHQVMNRIGLEEVDSKKKTFELSGGQKQRLAFVRAIIPKFTVLFGDEPTGNLDETNSRELLDLLKKHMQQNRQTAIIVSHNIDLTVEFADQVLVLTKNGDYGEFLMDNVFLSKREDGNCTWHNAEGRPIDDISNAIRALI